MGEIKFFSNREEGDPENGLAQPYADLRDWRDEDERGLPEFQELIRRYPEAFSPQANSASIDEQRRAIYPEAFNPITSSEYVEENIRPSVKAPVRKINSLVQHRVLDVMNSLGKPREMRAPVTSGSGKNKLKRVKTPGLSRASVRDMLRGIMREL